METGKKLRKELPVLALLLAPVIYLVAVWDRLPERLPVHWNLHGEVDGYGFRYTMALLTAGLYVLMLVLPRIDPRKKNYELFSGTYYKLRLLLVLFMGVLSAAIISKAVGFDIDLQRIIVIVVALLFTVLGNYLGTIKPNWFVGIRVPWTLESETVWRKTHRLAGRIWFFAGLVLLVLSFALPAPVLHPVMFAVVLAMVAVPVVYSYLLYRREKEAEKKTETENKNGA